MKKLLLFLVPLAFLFSCNVELSAEQFRAQNGKQCKKQIAKQFLDADATDDEKEKFCDCYADYMVGDADVITMKEIMKKSTNADALTAAMDNCSTEAKSSDAVTEEPSDVEPMEEPAE